MSAPTPTPAPTQVEHPWRATIRTAVAYALGLIAFLIAAIPIISETVGDYLPDGWVGWLVSAGAFLTVLSSLITRLMALAKAQALLGKVGLSATGKGKHVDT